MRVLYLIDNYSLGGAQTIVKGIMDNNINNYDIFSIALRNKRPFMEIHNPRAIHINSNSKFSFYPVLFIKKIIRQYNIDIIHCQLPRSILFGYILKRFFFPHIKWIIHEQGDIFESKLYALLLKLIYKKANCIFACSKATAEMMNKRSKIPLNQIGVLYNFADLQRFHNHKTKELKVKTIGFAGRIEKRKGWREFLIAAGLLHDQNFRFLIAGSGSEIKSMKKLQKKLKVTNIEYVGFVKEMEKFYATIDLLIVPSYFEPMGMVAVEAMACGVLVAVSDVPGLNEVVIKNVNGWLFKPQSAASLVKVISEISQTNEQVLIKFQQMALLLVNEFSYKTFDLKINNLYKNFN